MDMPGKGSSKIEQRKGVENIDPVNYQEPNVSADWQVNGNNLTNSLMIPVSDSVGELCSRAPAAAVAGIPDSFGLPIWEQSNNNGGLNLGGFCDANAADGWAPNSAFRSGIGISMFMPNIPGMLPPPSLPHLPSDSAFIERAARFSCFGGGNLGEMMMSSFAAAAAGDSLAQFPRAGLGIMQTQMPLPHEVFTGNEMKSHEMSAMEVEKRALRNESNEAEFSGRGAQEEARSPAREPSQKGLDSKKRKRSEKDAERAENNDTPQPSSADTAIKQKGDQNPGSAGKPGGKNVKQGSQGSDPPKEEYIHVRARRGQATNSHSLAERVRREKISERMKFLQDLVPGCSKVTGKAVMLDEIINYVQSLQRQVEFLSMKLATVNPRLDFNIEAFLAKDSRPGLSPSLPFPPDMTIPFSQLHPSQPSGIIQMGLLGNSSETHRRPVNLQSNPVYKEPTSQVPSVWEDELHNVVHMGFNSNAPINSQDLSGSLQSGHMKTEP